MIKLFIKNLSKQNLFLGMLFGTLIVIFTWPLLFKMNTHIAGFFSTDETFGVLWAWWWMKFSVLHRLNPLHSDFISAPGGANFPVSIYPFWTLITLSLTFFLKEVFVYNLYVLLSYVLAGFFMYKLAMHVLKDKIPAAFAAVAFAFCPYHVVRTWQHIGLAQIQFIPLFILLILKLREKSDFRRIAFAGLSFFLVASFDFYYAYFMFIVVFLLMVYSLLKEQRGMKVEMTKSLFFVLLIGCVLSFIALLPNTKFIVSGYVDTKQSVYSVRRPLEDFFTQSARPLSYLLPAFFNPLLGGFTEQFLGSDIYGTSLTEHSLYLGWVPLILLFFGFKKKKDIASYDEAYARGFFVLLALIAWFLSQPPWWNVFGLKIWMPQFIIYKFIPLFRANCRFGIVLMLAVSLLAGFGLKSFLTKLKTVSMRVILIILVFTALLFEFWTWPPYKVIEVTNIPKVYSWLRDIEGDPLIAEYPLDLKSPNEVFKFYQITHQKRMINGAFYGTDAYNAIQSLGKLSDPETVSRLNKMGVVYIIVHPQDYLSTGLAQDEIELNGISSNPNLKLLASYPEESCAWGEMCLRQTGKTDVYEVKK